MSWRVECDANVRAAERVAGRCVEKAERFDETRSAFATVLGALDAAVAGAFSRAVAGEGEASLVPDFDALRPVALAPPTGRTLDYGVGPNADEEESDAVNEDAMDVVEGDAESVDAKSDAESGRGSSREEDAPDAPDDVSDGAPDAPDDVSVSVSVSASVCIPARRVASAAEARGVWAATQLASRVSSLAASRDAALEEARSARERASDAERALAEANDARFVAETAKTDAEAAELVDAEAARVDAERRVARLRTSVEAERRAEAENARVEAERLAERG